MASRLNIQNELMLNLICRTSLQDAYKADDERCGICPGNKCQVTENKDPNSCFTKDIAPPTATPYIVTFNDAYFREGEFCMLFEYMGNGNLHQLCERGWIPSNYDMAVICYSVLSALIELHSKHIIHRDIKVHTIILQINAIMVYLT